MRKLLFLVADTHQGSPVALPPNGTAWDFIDGGSKPFGGWQVTFWNHWCECADRVGDLRSRYDQLVIVHAGDAIEGVHHQTVQLLTQRVDEQERMHVAAMQELQRRAKFDPAHDRIIYLSGTPAHSGNGNSSTERIARMMLGLAQDARLDGSVITPRINKTINGVLFDIAHKGFKLSSRRWLHTNSIRAYLMDRYVKSLEAKRPMPRYVVRAHYHTFGHEHLEDARAQTVSDAFLMPAWKIRDEYVEQFAPEAVQDIGALVFVIEADGSSSCTPMLMTCDPDPVEEL